jgi:hypothetical protein
MNDDQVQQAEEFRLGREQGLLTAAQDEEGGRYDAENGANRYREVNHIPNGLDLHADFASARSGFIAGYQSLRGGA